MRTDTKIILALDFLFLGVVVATATIQNHRVIGEKQEKVQALEYQQLMTPDIEKVMALEAEIQSLKQK